MAGCRVGGRGLLWSSGRRVGGWACQSGAGMAAIRVNAAVIWSAQGQVAGMRSQRRRWPRVSLVAALAAGQSGGGVQHAVAQPFRLGQGEVAVQAEPLEPADQVGGDRGGGAPGGGNGELARGQPADHAVDGTSDVPFLAMKPVDVAITSFPCSRGTSAYLHANERPFLTITVNHPG
jgi:hypothetical protein